MTRSINLDTKYNLTQVRAAADLLLDFFGDIHSITANLPAEKSKELLRRSATLRKAARFRQRIKAVRLPAPE